MKVNPPRTPKHEEDHENPGSPKGLISILTKHCGEQVKVNGLLLKFIKISDAPHLFFSRYCRNIICVSALSIREFSAGILKVPIQSL